MTIKNRNGFSLVELLVVISIIVILASLLLPMLKTARQRANITNCASNLKQFALAYQMFAQDHNRNFPVSASELYGSSGDRDIYPDYLNNAHVFWCPSDVVNTALNSISSDTDAQVSYRYVFGLQVANYATVSIPMISDRCRWNTTPNPDRFESNHVQGANTLYIDGSVRWADYAQDDLPTDTSFFSIANVGPGNVAGASDGASIAAPANPAWGQ